MVLVNDDQSKESDGVKMIRNKIVLNTKSQKVGPERTEIAHLC